LYAGGYRSHCDNLTERGGIPLSSSLNMKGGIGVIHWRNLLEKEEKRKVMWFEEIFLVNL
jgi:hypothetical protein